MNLKIFLCFLTMLTSLSPNPSKDNESFLESYPRATFMLAAAVGAVYTAQQWINDGLGNSEPPEYSTTQTMLVYSQAVFSCIILGKILELASKASQTTLEKIADYKFGNKHRYEKELGQTTFKRISKKEEWTGKVNYGISCCIGFADTISTTYLLSRQLSTLCTEPFDVISAVGFLEAFCMGAVIFGNTRCLISSEKFDNKLPWKQFSEGVRKMRISQYIRYWQILCYNESFKPIVYNTPDEYDMTFEPTITLRSVELLNSAFFGSSVKDMTLGAGEIFRNVWRCWLMLNEDKKIHHGINKSTEPSQEMPRSVKKINKTLVAAPIPRAIDYFTEEEPQLQNKQPQTPQTIKDREILKHLPVGIFDEEEQKNIELQTNVSVIPENLEATLKSLIEIQPPLKEILFNRLLNDAIDAKKREGYKVSKKNDNNSIKITLENNEGQKVTLNYEPTHKQNGQNSTEYSGWKLYNALRAVQNIYLIGTTPDVQDELDSRGLIRRIKGARGFVGFILNNK